MADRIRKLQLKTGFEGKPTDDLDVTAFVFDEAGALVASAPLRRGSAELALRAADTGQPRILLGPTALAEGGAVTLERLRRAGAHEPAFRLEPGARSLELQPIPEIDWQRWLLCRCHVRGKVVRPVAFPFFSAELPVCKA
ncbi:MAG: hypothetical protein ACRDZW_00320, partial [Acidimicrobiales bacterium]